MFGDFDNDVIDFQIFDITFVALQTLHTGWTGGQHFDRAFATFGL